MRLPSVKRGVAVALLLSTCVLGMLAMPPASSARSVSKIEKKVFRDYAKDGKLKHVYTIKQLKRVLRRMDPDTRQYASGYRKAIRREIRYVRRHSLSRSASRA